MEHYNAVVENGGERIMTRWEDESAHRRRMSTITVASEAFQRVAGTVFGGLATLGSIGAAAWLVYHGFGVPGALVGLVGLGGVTVPHGVNAIRRR